MKRFDEGTAAGLDLSFPKEGKYLTFRLADEEYGISILSVREIFGIAPITGVPNLPPHVKGVINLRGRVIPVLDMRLRFQMEAAEYDGRTCIVVVESGGESKTVLTGMIVDSVSEVLHIARETIQQAPAFGAGIDAGCILGIATMEDGVKILLDIERVLNSEDILLDPRIAA